MSTLTDSVVQINDFLSSYIPQPRDRRNARHRQQLADDDAAAESDEDIADAVDEMDMRDGTGDRRIKAKYLRVLRKVANRQTTEVVIDLSDLKKVCISSREPSDVLD